MRSTLNDGEIMDNPVIQKARKDDAKSISDLILSVANYFTLHPEGIGAERFLASMSPAAIEKYIDNPDFDYYVCHVGCDLAGVVAAKERNHLFHLFVAKRFQKNGFSKILWRHLKANVFDSSGADKVTVNSTPYAVPVYEKFGFASVGSKVERDGIAFVPMLFVAHPFNNSNHSHQ